MQPSSAVVKRLISRSLVLFVVIHTLGCGSTSVTQLASPDPPRCRIDVTGAPSAMPAAGGRVDVGVVAERECTWTATSEAAWLKVSPASGQGDTSLALTASANPQASSRTGNLVLNGSRFAINQAPAPCTFAVSPGSATIAAGGGTASAHVTTLAGCSWDTGSDVAWVHLAPAAASSDGEVTVTVDANAATTERTAAVTIAGQTFTVNQAAVTPLPVPAPVPAPAPTPGPVPSPVPSPTPEPTPQCTYDIDPQARTFKDKGGDGTVKVITSPSCPWTASPTVDWIHIKDNASGTGTLNVKYHVDANHAERGRIGTITVAGRTHTVLQAGHD
jgi:hypothetical protein